MTKKRPVMGLAKTFRELRTYRAALKAATEVFALTSNFRKEETYALTDQMRRSSRAVSALVAEAWGRRTYPADFANKLSMGIGEAQETMAWLDHAYAYGYITREELERRCSDWSSICGMMARMIQMKDQFSMRL